MRSDFGEAVPGTDAPFGPARKGPACVAINNHASRCTVYDRGRGNVWWRRRWCVVRPVGEQLRRWLSLRLYESGEDDQQNTTKGTSRDKVFTIKQAAEAAAGEIRSPVG